MNKSIILKSAALFTALILAAAAFSGCGPTEKSEPEQTKASSVESSEVSSTSAEEQKPEETLYGYDSLSTDALKSIYDTIGENVKNLSSTKMNFTGTTTLMFDEALSAYEDDHPEVFWLNVTSRYSYIDDDGDLEIELNYDIDGDELSQAQQAFDSKVDEIVSKASSGMSDYETEIFANDYVIDNCDYVSGATMCHSAYGALVNGQAVCDGYSKAFQVICTKLGVECVGINGLCPEFNEENGENSDEGHMWNCVKVGGEWYHVDVTWNDGDSHIQRYLYLNMTTDEIKKNHVISPLYSERTSDDSELYNNYVPECTATEYNYLDRECVTVTDLDQDDELLAAFTKAAADKEEYFDFLIDDSLDYAATTDAISESYGFNWIEAVNSANSGGPQISTDSNFYTYESVNAVTFELKYEE